MKKIYIFALAALALLAASCAKETFNKAGTNDATITRTFTVSAPESTRTELDGVKVLWSTGDEINVIARTSGNQYTFILTDGAGSATAKFSGKIAEADASETEFYALYPNVGIRSEESDDKGNRWALDLGQLVIDVPVTSQEAVEGGFPVTAAFLTAVSDADGNLAFRHGAAYFKLGITQDNIESIHLEVSGGARLGGRPIYTMSTGATFQVNGAKNFMDFTCEGGFKKGSTYYLPVLTKQSDCGKLTVTFNGPEGKTTSITTSSLEKVKLASGKIYDLGSPEVSFDPSISAEDVVIDATATSSSIEVSIVNPTEDGVLSAQLTEASDWLSIGSVSGNTIALTATANTGATRTAQVEITYTYSGTQSVSTQVEVTQGPGSGGSVSHTYVFYINDSREVVQTKDGADGSYFTVTGDTILDCSESGYFTVDSFTINGTAYSHAKKIDSGNNIAFTTSSSATTTIRFYAAKRQADKDGTIKLQKGSSNIVNAAMTLGTLYDSGVVNLDKGTSYKFNKSGEVGVFYVEVVETF